MVSIIGMGMGMVLVLVTMTMTVMVMVMVMVMVTIPASNPTLSLSLLMSGTRSLPPATASEPPSQKSYCISTMINAGRVMIGQY